MTDAITAWLEERKQEYERARVMRIAGHSLVQMSNLGKALSPLPRLVAALEEVAGTHTRTFVDPANDWCCECEKTWPCATIRAVESALGVRDE